MLAHDIKPIIVIDGSFEEGKKSTLWKRTKEQLERALACKPATQSYCTVMPIFAKDIFMDAIKSLNIEIIQTFGEADRFIAHLASRVLSCPVFSNDSDFLIFGGVEVIKIDSIDIGNLSHGNGSLRCKKFKRQSFLKFFGLESDELLPLCAAILGNDETMGKSQLSSVVDRIFAQVKKEKLKKSSCKRHQRMTAILKWVGRERNSTIDQALDRLLQPVPAGNQREDARKLVMSATNSYIFGGQIEDCQKNKCDCVETVWPVGGERIKQQFMKGNLYSWSLDVIRSHHFYFQSQIEDAQSKSAISRCLPIVTQICWNLLQKNDEIPVSITARSDGKKLTTISVTPEQKFILTNEDLFCQVIKFWCENSDVSQMELAAVILFSMRNDFSNVEETFFAKVPSKVCLGKRDYYDETMIHSLSNFQAILYFIKVLNKLENDDYRDFFPMKRWSGLQMHTIIQGFSNVSFLLKELKCENEEAEFLRIFQQFVNLTSSRLNSTELPKKKGSKKQSRKSNLECKEDFQRESSSKKIEDIQNRFGLLSLDIA